MNNKPPAMVKRGSSGRHNRRGRRLRVRLRPEPEEESSSSSPCWEMVSNTVSSSSSSSSSTWNLFARLPPRVARELVTTTTRHDSFLMIKGQEVDFLPLQIRFVSSGETVYASYNGGEVRLSSSSGARDYDDHYDDDDNNNIIELPACLIPPASTGENMEGQEVEVSVLPLLKSSSSFLSSSSSSASSAFLSSSLSNNNNNNNAIPPSLLWCRDADQVLVEPLTLDDWTLLSMHASWLESGGLLRQVSIVYPNQVVPMVVDDDSNNLDGATGRSSNNFRRIRDVVRFRVLPWGEDEEEEEQQQQQKESAQVLSSLMEDKRKIHEKRHFLPSCLRLVANTRVIVIPPPESSSSPSTTDDTTPILRIYPSLLDYNRAMRELASYLEKNSHKSNSKKKNNNNHDEQVVPVRVEQFCALVHPHSVAPWFSTFGNGGADRRLSSSASSFDEGGFLAVIESSSRDGNNKNRDCGDSSGDGTGGSSCSSNHRSSVIVRARTSLAVPRDGIVLHPLTRLDLQVDLLVDRVSLKPLSPEQELEIGRVRQQIGSTKVQFGLERVDLKRQRNDPSWRFPDCSVGQRESGFGKSWAQGKLHDSLSVEPPVEMRNVPLRIGAIFSLPWTQSRSSSLETMRLFRLTVIATGEHVVSGANEWYVMARDVEDLIHLKAISPTQYNRITSISIAATESPYLTKALLPYSSCWEALFSNYLHSRRSLATLVCGEIGSGKTYASLLIGARAQLLQGRAVVYLDCQKLKSGRGLRLQDILQQLLSVFQCAQRSLHSTIILDDLDEILPHIDNGIGNGSRNVQPYNPVMLDQCQAIGGLLSHLLQGINSSECDFEIVCTCREPENLSAVVRSAFSTLDTVRLPCLSPNDREGLLYAFLDRLQDGQTSSMNAGERQIASEVEFGPKTLSFRPRDLEQLAHRLLRALVLTHMPKFHDCLEEALQEYVPLSKRAASTEQIEHDYTLKDIGGLFNVKRELTATILRPARYHRIYRNSQVRLPRGLLLFGPPGCGKSYIVPALARECGYPLIMCRGCEILDKYIGASEMKVRELFSRAASVAPSLLWIDELDALAPRRGSDNTGVTDRIVNQLLTFLDGVEDPSASGTIYVVASSSRPDKIDPALLRPGRLERHVYVGLPENDEEFSDLLVKISMNYNISEQLADCLSSGKFLTTLARQVSGFLDLSPADLRSAFTTAQILAAHEVLEFCLGYPTRERESIITMDHLVQAFRSTKPSLASEDRVKLDTIYAWFRNQSYSRKPESSEIVHANELRVALK